jgi:hypothetical protein
MYPSAPRINSPAGPYTGFVPLLGKQVLETIFTAFAVPAFLVPLVWLAAKLSGRSGGWTGVALARSLTRLQAAHAVSSALLISGAVLAELGVPLERGGKPLTLLAWALYGGVNIVFAGLLLRMVSGYGNLPDGKLKDALFLRFMAITALQPITTAGAFTLLYHLLRLVYHEKFPWLDVSPEGI